MSSDATSRGEHVTEPENAGGGPPALIPASAFTRTTEQYVFAVVGYLLLAIVTKVFLTFTMGLLYFVLTLDLLPRLYQWIRRASRTGRDATPNPEVSP